VGVGCAAVWYRCLTLGTRSVMGPCPAQKHSVGSHEGVGLFLLDVKYLMQHCIYYLARLHKSSAEQDIRPACCTLAHPPCSVAQPRQFTNFGLA
jgi:hypothetical protein